MSQWIDLRAVAEIVIVGLLAGAGLPAVFAVGVRALGATAGGQQPAGGHPAGGSIGGSAVALLCFAIVLGAIGYGIYLIVASGHK